MLERLLSCKDLEDFTALGTELLSDEGMTQLQSDIRQKKLVFSSEAYWSKDKFSLYSPRELTIQAEKEEYASRVLHLLQLLQNFCPAIATSVAKLLNRTTC